MTGGFSRTVMVCDAETVLEHASFDVQVCTMIVGQEPLVTDTRVTITLGSQASDAVTTAGAGTSGRHE